MAPQGDQSNSGMGPIWIVIILFIAIFVIWYFGRVYIVEGFFYIKLMEISLIQFFTPGLDTLKNVLTKTNPETVTFSQLTQVANYMGNYLRIPAAIILALFGIILFYRNTASQFRKTHTMKSLLEVDTQTWPQEKLIEQADLVKTNIEVGPWAMAKTPMAFAKHYKLLKVNKPLLGADQLSREGRLEATIIKSRARRLFSMQLGQQWRGVDALNKHTQFLFTIFAARAARDSKVAQTLLNQVSASVKNGRPNFSGYEILLAKHKDDPIVKAVIEKHAYVYTIMASLLQVAREDGVLPCSEFLWLKPIDRRLWFMLNTVGRQTAVVEMAGAVAHWLAEKEFGKPIRTPMIDQAVMALEEAIVTVKYNSDTDF